MSCKRHPHYQAKRPPTANCADCWRVYREKMEARGNGKRLTDIPAYDVVIAAIAEHKTHEKAADVLGLSVHSLRRILDGKLSDKTLREIGHPQVSAESAELPPLDQHRLRQENQRLKERLKEEMDAKLQDTIFAEFASLCAIEAREQAPWLLEPPKRSGAMNSVVACAAYSDAHWGEGVNPAEVEHSNGYSPEIASWRTDNFFRNVLKVCDGYLTGVRYEGFVLNLLGDNISGDIHAELVETNMMTTMEAVLDVVKHLTAGISMLAEFFGRVQVVAVPGNHARTTMKPQAKLISRKNFDWLIAKILADKFSNDGRVTFLISDGPDARFNVLNTSFLATHGDQFKGGSGIAGLLSPMMIGDHRKRKRAASMKTPYDWMLMGHWHNLVLGFNGIIINGTIKGYDEYAYRSNFAFGLPEQAFWLVDAEYGITTRMPIHVIDEREEWRPRAGTVGTAMTQGLPLAWGEE